jgi:outer membrane protein
MQRFMLVALAAVAVPTFAFAQGPGPQGPSAGPAAPLKIAYINSREILQRTPGYAHAESMYTKEVEGYRGEVQKLQQQLDSAVQAFDQQSIALSPAARQTKQKDLQAMQQRMEQRTNELQDRARQREQELLQPIQARVSSVIQGIRAEMNYALILDADAAGGLIAAADPALNITARVLQRLSQAQ